MKFCWFEFAWPMESAIIRRYDLVQIGMALLNEVYHCGGGL